MAACAGALGQSRPVTDPFALLLVAAGRLGPSAGIATALIGGVARSAWASSRATEDVDLLAGCTDPAPILRVAESIGLVVDAQEVETLRMSGMTRLRLADHPRGAIRMDIVLADHPYYLRVLNRAVVREVLGERLSVACAEDLILLKLLADRPQDRADVAAIHLQQGARLRKEILRDEAQVLEIELPEGLR